jgi:hypothetical protein
MRKSYHQTLQVSPLLGTNDESQDRNGRLLRIAAAQMPSWGTEKEER